MTRNTLDGIAHAYARTSRGEQDYALKPLHHVWEQGMAHALLGPSGGGTTTRIEAVLGAGRSMQACLTKSIVVEIQAAQFNCYRRDRPPRARYRVTN